MRDYVFLITKSRNVLTKLMELDERIVSPNRLKPKL